MCFHIVNCKATDSELTVHHDIGTFVINVLGQNLKSGGLQFLKYLSAEKSGDLGPAFWKKRKPQYGNVSGNLRKDKLYDCLKNFLRK